VVHTHPQAKPSLREQNLTTGQPWTHTHTATIVQRYWSVKRQTSAPEYSSKFSLELRVLRNGVQDMDVQLCYVSAPSLALCFCWPLTYKHCCWVNLFRTTPLHNACTQSGVRKSSRQLLQTGSRSSFYCCSRVKDPFPARLTTFSAALFTNWLFYRCSIVVMWMNHQCWTKELGELASRTLMLGV
jgi:hypothetical protein